MSEKASRLKLIYGFLKARYGFNDDASFMSAWSKNPEKWAPIFAVRQNLIEAITSE